MKNDKLPHYLKAIIASDPELVAILNQNTKEDKKYSFDFKTSEQKTALTGVLLGSNGFELFKKILTDLIDENDFNISYLKECLYFSVPFLGIAKVYPFLKEVAKFVGKNEISLSKQDYAAKDNSTNKDLRHHFFIPEQVLVSVKMMLLIPLKRASTNLFSRSSMKEHS